VLTRIRKHFATQSCLTRLTINKLRTTVFIEFIMQIVIDIDLDKVIMARHNARIYGVEQKIKFTKEVASELSGYIFHPKPSIG